MKREKAKEMLESIINARINLASAMLANNPISEDLKNAAQLVEDIFLDKIAEDNELAENYKMYANYLM